MIANSGLDCDVMSVVDRDEMLAQIRRSQQINYDLGHHPFHLMHQFNTAAVGRESKGKMLVLRAKAHTHNSIYVNKKQTDVVEDEIIEQLKPIWDGAQMADSGNFFFTVKLTVDPNSLSLVLIEIYLNSGCAESVSDLGMYMKLCGSEVTEMDFTV